MKDPKNTLYEYTFVEEATRNRQGRVRLPAPLNLVVGQKILVRLRTLGTTSKGYYTESCTVLRIEPDLQDVMMSQNEDGHNNHEPTVDILVFVRVN